MGFLWFIIIGIVAGFVAGKLMRGGGFGLLVNLVVGIIRSSTWWMGVWSFRNNNNRYYWKSYNCNSRSNYSVMDYIIIPKTINLSLE